MKSIVKYPNDMKRTLSEVPWTPYEEIISELTSFAWNIELQSI